jgi:hypothetical protein
MPAVCAEVDTMSELQTAEACAQFSVVTSDFMSPVDEEVLALSIRTGDVVDRRGSECIS